MHTRNRLVGLTIALTAMVALVAGCQSQDSSLLTEAERSIESAADLTPEENIRNMITELIGDPKIEQSSLSQFNNIVKSKSATDRIKRAKALFDYLTKHYLAGKWEDVDEDGRTGIKTGNLIFAIGQYVGLYPDGQGSGATCLPGNDCEAEPTTGLTTIPASLITQPFTVIMTETECDPLFGPNVVPPCYEIQTYPEGITFEASASTSLSLSADTSPFVAICSAFTQDYSDSVGTQVFLWHVHDGVLEQMVNSQEFAICDNPPALSSRWANPLFATFKPVLTILSPQPLYAKGTGVGIGTAISNFSQVASCEPGCLPTTTTVSIVGGTTTFHADETITIRAVVSPAPNDGEPEVVFRIQPLSAGLAPVEPVIDGVAQHAFVCGSADVPIGGHYTAGAAFLGTAGYRLSLSGQVLSFDCN